MELPSKKECTDFLNISSEKWIAIFLLTTLSLIFGLVPYIIFHACWKKRIESTKSYDSVVTSLSSVSGGVLLATTVLHILPEVREKAELNLIKIFTDGFPVAEMLMLFGFLMIYFLEEFAHFIRKNHPRIHFHHHSKLNDEMDTNHRKLKAKCQTLLTNKEEDEEAQIRARGDSIMSTTTTEAEMINYDIGNHLNSNKKRGLSSIRVLISLLALSVHGLMEGMAIGFQESNNLWLTFGAVASHKLIIAFCLGMELMKSRTNLKTFFASILLFTIVSPLGIIIGSTLSSSEEFVESNTLVVIEGLACGTLLYVVFFEILTWNHGHLKTHGTFGLIQFFGTFTGILFSAYLISQTQHHDHFDYYSKGNLSNQKHDDTDHKSN